MSFKGTNLFAQIVEMVDRPAFARIVRMRKAEHGAKGFVCWDQLVSMLFCHLGKAQSLREICGGLATSMGKLGHLGMRGNPKRSTLSYANVHRPHAVFEDLFYHLLGKCQNECQGKRPFRFKNKLFSMDATFIDLCLSLFDWAHFRRTKGAVKLHLLLDHDGYLPTFAHITEGTVNDRKVMKNQVKPLFQFPKGSIIVFDRGYTDYEMFAYWCRKKVYFVTRMQSNATYDVEKELTIPKHSTIRRDTLIRPNGPLTSKKCPHTLRRIEVWDEANQEMLVLLTNHLTFGSTTIARIYKERWQIEIFFKAIKQHLKIKTFVGTSPNAVKIQLWTALIAMLLLKLMKYRSTFGWSLSNLVAMLRFNLFTYRDLHQWLNEPYESLPLLADTSQLALSFSALGQQEGAYSDIHLQICPN
jgi:hypothetical protein